MVTPVGYRGTGGIPKVVLDLLLGIAVAQGLAGHQPLHILLVV